MRRDSTLQTQVPPAAEGMDHGWVMHWHEPVCRVDAIGNVYQLNLAWQEKVANIGSEGQSWLSLLYPEDHERALDWWPLAMDRRDTSALECRLISADGGAIWHQLRLHRLNERYTDGAHWLCVASDIHSLKLREQELRELSQMQGEMLNVGVDCIKLITPDGRLLHMNRAGCLALGVTEGTARGRVWLELLPPEVRDVGEAALSEARAGRPARFAGRSVLPGQPVQHWDNRLTPVTDADGAVSSILCVSREVTAERVAQESLRQSEERLQMAARVGGMGVWDYDLQHDVLHCDDSWYRIMGRDPAQPIRSIAEFRPMIHPEDVARATEVDATATQLVNSHGDYGVEFRILRPDGEIRWLRSAACVMPDDAGAPARAVGFVMDITNAKRGELALLNANFVLAQEKEALARQSLQDPLTGLSNRRCLDSELERLCAQAQRLPMPLAIAMVDVDHFKAYNDRYGHLQGDAALQGVARALQSISRKNDVVARYGGEEFVIVFPGVLDPQPALARLDEAIAALDIRHDDSPFGSLTVSCGCVTFPAGSSITPSALLLACDKAVYEAKSAGRNRVVLRTESSYGGHLGAPLH